MNIAFGNSSLLGNSSISRNRGFASFSSPALRQKQTQVKTQIASQFFNEGKNPSEVLNFITENYTDPSSQALARQAFGSLAKEAGISGDKGSSNVDVFQGFYDALSGKGNPSQDILNKLDTYQPGFYEASKPGERGFLSKVGPTIVKPLVTAAIAYVGAQAGAGLFKALSGTAAAGTSAGTTTASTTASTVKNTSSLTQSLLSAPSGSGVTTTVAKLSGATAEGLLAAPVGSSAGITTTKLASDSLLSFANLKKVGRGLSLLNTAAGITGIGSPSVKTPQIPELSIPESPTVPAQDPALLQAQQDELTRSENERISEIQSLLDFYTRSRNGGITSLFTGSRQGFSTRSLLGGA